MHALRCLVDAVQSDDAGVLQLSEDLDLVTQRDNMSLALADTRFMEGFKRVTFLRILLFCLSRSRYTLVNSSEVAPAQHLADLVLALHVE